MALAWKTTTTTGAVAAGLVAGGAASILHGYVSTNAEAANFYVKIWWEGTGTAAPTNFTGGNQPATTIPVAGTTIPSLTIQVNTTGMFSLSDIRVTNGGRMWFWVTKNAADTDATALPAGGDVITFIYE